MSKPDTRKDKIKRISAYKSHAGLLKLWQKAQKDKAKSWPKGIAFEYLLLRAFDLDAAIIRESFRFHCNCRRDEHAGRQLHTLGLRSTSGTAKTGTGVVEIAISKQRVAGIQGMAAVAASRLENLKSATSRLRQHICAAKVPMVKA